jgi:hypothetical protein
MPALVEFGGDRPVGVRGDPGGPACGFVEVAGVDVDLDVAGGVGVDGADRFLIVIMGKWRTSYPGRILAA